jgi:hypothetical protein
MILKLVKRQVRASLETTEVHIPKLGKLSNMIKKYVLTGENRSVSMTNFNAQNAIRQKAK